MFTQKYLMYNTIMTAIMSIVTMAYDWSFEAKGDLLADYAVFGLVGATLLFSALDFFDWLLPAFNLEMLETGFDFETKLLLLEL